MSYSLNDRCFECKKGGKDWESKCTDKVVLRNTINMIHDLGNTRGHLGSGSIELKCANFEKVEE